MKLVCIRDGRMGYSSGDVVNVPDDVDAFDTTYFRVKEEPKPEPEVVKRDPETQVAEKTEEED